MKSVFKHIPLMVLFSGIINIALGQSDEFEKVPTFKASGLIQHDLLESPYYTIHENVKMTRYGYQFAIERNGETTQVWSKELLLMRIQEFSAIEKLNEISKTEAFIYSLKVAAKNPIMSAVTLVKKPVTTIKGLPSGVSRYLKGKFYFARKTTSQISDEVRDLENEEDDESITDKATRITNDASKEHLGYNKAKRLWARRLNVDPYSDNKELQSALERIAWATSIGFFAADAAIPGNDIISYTNNVRNIVWNTPAIELELQNDKRLKKVNLDSEIIKDFHEHPYYRLSDKTAISLDFETLNGIKNLSSLMEIVLGANDIYEGRMIVNLMKILRKYHRLKTPIQKIEIRRGVATAIDEDGILIFPIVIEHIYWTELVSEISRNKELNHPKRELWISGDATQTSIEQLGMLDWPVTQNCFALFAELDSKSNP